MFDIIMLNIYKRQYYITILQIKHSIIYLTI